MAGIIHSVGRNVYEFRPGDRVAAIHEFGTPNGAFAEYAIAPAWTTFHLPPDVSFEEAATVPNAAFTAAIGLYAEMGLPTPYNQIIPAAGSVERIPILIYGVTSAVGAFAAKFARLSGLGPVIGVAGKSSELASTLVDHVVDYRGDSDAVVVAVEKILYDEGFGPKVPVIFDAISEGNSLEIVARLIDPAGGRVCIVLPTILFAKDKENFQWPVGVEAYNSICPRIMSDLKDFGYMWSRYLGKLLGEGRLTGHPYELIPHGLHGVLQGLRNLRDGKARGVKYVFRVADTPSSPPQVVGSLNVHPRGENTHPMRNFPFPA
jgi:NADPH2:quinone reductase